MDTNLLITFIILSIVNVIAQTIKSIVTVNGGKMLASIVNALTFGLYTVVLVFTNADFPLWQKVLVTAFTNFVGVYIVKYFEEKARKDKLWKVECTVDTDRLNDLLDMLALVNLPYTNVLTENTSKAIVNVFCATQKESVALKEILTKFNVKFFVTESKNL